MRGLKIFFVVLVLVFAAFAVSNAMKKPDDSDWYGQIWSYAAANADGRSLKSVLEAIRSKNDARFKDALQKFIEMSRSSSYYRSQAVYTLAKIDSNDAEGYFNSILSDPILFDATIFRSQSWNKYEALTYMHELGMELDNHNIDLLLREVRKFIELNYPALALEIAAPLTLHGVELNSQDKKNLANIVEAKWHNVNPENLKLIDLDLDWEKMFAKAYPQNARRGPWSKNNPPPNYHSQKLNELFILLSNDTDRLELSRSWSEEKEFKTDLARMKLVSAASVGEKEAIEMLKYKLTPTMAHFCLPFKESLPDDVLLRMLSSEDIMKSVGTPMLLVELENRGYQDEVDRFVKKWESTFRFEDINDHKSLMRDFKRVWQFTKLDTGKYMDAMWQLLEEYPNNGDIAHELVQYRTMCRIFDIDGIEDFDRWVAKNPDKFAKALRIVLDTCSDPATAKRDLEVDLIPDYSKKDLAFRMMLFLPEATFNKHFANLDSKYFTKSAYLTGNHFKAKWAFGKQQQAFYDRYSNRN